MIWFFAGFAAGFVACFIAVALILLSRYDPYEKGSKE